MGVTPWSLDGFCEGKPHRSKWMKTGGTQRDGWLTESVCTHQGRKVWRKGGKNYPCETGNWLVVFSNPSEKYEFVNWDDNRNPIYGKIKFMFQTTNQEMVEHIEHILKHIFDRLVTAFPPVTWKSRPNFRTVKIRIGWTTISSQPNFHRGKRCQPHPCDLVSFGVPWGGPTMTFWRTFGDDLLWMSKPPFSAGCRISFSHSMGKQSDVYVFIYIYIYTYIYIYIDIWVVP